MKGQAGIETLFGVSLLLIFLVFAFVTSVSKSSETQFAQTYLEAQKICYEIKNIINQISSYSFGAAVQVIIPNKIDSTDYNLTVDSNNKTLTIEWSNNLFSCTILTPNVTNNTHNKFTIAKGTKTFKNSNGVVIIE